MIDELKDSGNVVPVKDAIPSGSETVGESTMSLFSMTPVVLEPGLIVLEKFRIIDLLGQGGMGSVYRVEHLLMERQFALKCLNKFQSADGAWRRFQNEAKAAHLLDHANLLKVYEFGLLPGGQPFFLMELVEGVTLADEIKRHGQLPVERAVKLFIQVAFAISYAHESHVVHRDIKPSNIMVSRKVDGLETVKVVDFGIAKLTGVDEFNQQTLTKTGEIFGSPLYMSPEQCTGVAVDHRSDLYSLGCVFYETLTGAPPFMGESALSTMMKHQGDKALSLKEASLGTSYPYVLEEIIGKLLEKDPNNRYQSAKALAKDLIQLERRLNEESKSTLPSVDETQGLKRIETKQPEREWALSAPTISLLFALAAVVFASGALTSYLIVMSPQNQSVKVDLKNNKSEGVSDILDDTTISKASKEYASLHPGHTKNADDGFKDAKKSESAKLDEKAISKLREIYPPDPKYDTKVKTSKRWSVLNGSKREYSFPRKESLGLILTAGGETEDATGERSVPRDEAVGIVASDFLIKSPQLLKKFAPDELTLLDLNASKTHVPTFLAQIGDFSKLKFLNFYDTEFYPSDYPVLRKLKDLRYLNLAWTEVDCKELLKHICRQNLQSLDLSGTENGSEFLRSIHEFPKLQQLNLFHCDLKNRDIAYLRGTKLRSLCLMWNHNLDDRSIESISTIKNLERVNLSFLHVTPQCWRWLVKLPHLQKVKLANMPWSSAEKLYFANQMKTYAPTVMLDFSSTYFTDFTFAMTDTQWLNEGADSHNLPGWVWYHKKKDKPVKKDRPAIQSQAKQHAT